MAHLSLEHDIRLQPFQNIVIPEKGIFRHVQNRATSDKLIVGVVENLDDPYLLKVNLLHRALIRNNSLALRYLAGVHRHNYFVNETPLADVEKVIKRFLKFIQSLRMFD